MQDSQIAIPMGSFYDHVIDTLILCQFVAALLVALRFSRGRERERGSGKQHGKCITYNMR